MVSLSLRIRLDVHDRRRQLFLSVLSPWDFVFTLGLQSLNLELECGIHGQQKPILQTCTIGVVLKQRTGFVSNICAVLRCKHLLDTEVSVLDSLLYSEVPRVNVFRSLSCSQSIRQRIRRRTVTLYFHLHWNSQISVHRSQVQSNLTSFTTA